MRSRCSSGGTALGIFRSLGLGLSGRQVRLHVNEELWLVGRSINSNISNSSSSCDTVSTSAQQ